MFARRTFGLQMRDRELKLGEINNYKPKKIKQPYGQNKKKRKRLTAVYKTGYFLFRDKYVKKLRMEVTQSDGTKIYQLKKL